MNVDFISLPKDVVIPPAWLQTPADLKDKVDFLAQSSFANWKNDQISNLSLGVKLLSAGCIIGLGVSVFMLSIPGIILAGAGLVICLIGISAVQREQVGRCKKACLELEDWLIRFNTSCEDLKTVLLPLKDLDNSADINATLSKQDISTALKIFEDFPQNDLEILSTALKNHHHLIFGEWRRIGKGYWSSYWIEHHLNLDFGGTLKYFYIRIDGLKQHLRELEADTSYVRKHNVVTLHNAKLVLDKLIPSKAAPKATDPVSLKSQMYLLTDDLNASPQGKDHFDTLIEQSEYWRENIAIFRSSLS
jgi:hypothetical protein